MRQKRAFLPRTISPRLFGVRKKIGYLATSTRWDTFISELFLVIQIIFFGSMMMFSKKSEINNFEKHIKNTFIFVLKNIITGPQNIVWITKKCPEMNVSHRVDVARYPIFSPAPNIRKVTCFQKMIFQLAIIYKSLKDRLGRIPLRLPDRRLAPSKARV